MPDEICQETLANALEEARRAKQAGWFTLVLADGDGQLANVEGSPEELAIELHRGELSRVDYGSRRMTGVPDGEAPRHHPRSEKMYGLLEGARGRLDAATLQELLSDAGICNCSPTDERRQVRTIDAMVFDTTGRRAFLSRAPLGSRSSKSFSFDPAAPSR